MPFFNFLDAILVSSETLLLRTIVFFLAAIFLPHFLGNLVAPLLEMLKVLQKIILGNPQFGVILNWGFLGYAAVIIGFTALYTGIANILRKDSAIAFIGMAGFFWILGVLAAFVAFLVFSIGHDFLLDRDAIQVVIAGAEHKAIKSHSILENKMLWVVLVGFLAALVEVNVCKSNSWFYCACNDIKKESIKGLSQVVSVVSPWIVLGSIGDIVCKNDIASLVNASKGILLMIWSANAIQLSLLGLITWLVTRTSVWTIFCESRKPLAVGFAAGASKMALPEAILTLIRLKVSPEKAEFLVPLAGVFNMNGTSLYAVMMSLTLGYVGGIETRFETLPWLFLAATILAMGAAGIPMGVLAVMGNILPITGVVPENVIGFLFSIHVFIGRGNTIVNLWGDITASLILSFWQQKAEKKRKQ
jgi:Na+/H+-dicarboxylate symporter